MVANDERVAAIAGFRLEGVHFAVQTHAIVTQKCVRLPLGPFVDALRATTHLAEQHGRLVHAVSAAGTTIAVAVAGGA